MAIYLLVGVMIGKLLGLAMGIDASVGGVGIAMLLLTDELPEEIICKAIDLHRSKGPGELFSVLSVANNCT